MSTKDQKLTVPVAIIVAGAVIAGAIIISNGGIGSNNNNNNNNNQQAEQPTNNNGQNNPSEALKKVRPVTKEDHIKGDINAPIKIVEYSDFECPFCKNLHGTLNQIIDEYGKDGKVAWVYRHFPLEQLHPRNAKRAAIASECITELGGNDAFWGFADRWFAESPTNDRTDFDALTSKIVSELGIDKGEFTKCLDSGKYNDKVEADVRNAVETGGRGTPWSILIAEDGTILPISGAQPYENIKRVIDSILK